MTETSSRLPTKEGDIKSSSKSSISFDRDLSAPGLMGQERHIDLELGDRHVDLDDRGGVPTIARR